MVRLFYHLEPDFPDAASFVYVINQLAQVMETVCPIDFGDARSIYHSIARKDRKFAGKGLKAPRELFRTSRGGYALYNSLFLQCEKDGKQEIEYYWHRNLEEAFDHILQGGSDYLARLCSHS